MIKPPTLTPAEIRALLAKGIKSAQELDKQIAPMFGERPSTLVLK